MQKNQNQTKLSPWKIKLACKKEKKKYIQHARDMAYVDGPTNVVGMHAEDDKILSNHDDNATWSISLC
jgi:hypothetical protein